MVTVKRLSVRLSVRGGGEMERSKVTNVPVYIYLEQMMCLNNLHSFSVDLSFLLSDSKHLKIK